MRKMLDLEIEAQNWMKKNNVTITTERVTTLTKLLVKVENEAYNDGLRTTG